MKKIFRLFPMFLSALILFNLIPIHANAASFSDVSSNAWYISHIHSLSAKNILQGTGGGNFSPDKAITRAEIVAMMAKTVLSASEINQFKGSSSFQDVRSGDWYTPYVNWAYSAGVVLGDGDKKFRPNNAITRQEMARMIVNFSSIYGYTIPAKQSGVSFTDQSKIESWAKESVSTCQKGGIILGDAEGTFRPKSTAKRCEAAAMYDRFLTNKKNSDYTVTIKRVDGITVKAVEFSLTKYPAAIRMANGKINGNENMSSMISNTGAKFAMNAAYFEMDSLEPSTSIVSGGNVMKIDNNKPLTAFVMNSSRNASFVKNFKIYQTITLRKNSETFKEVKMNIAPNNGKDATRIIFDRSWGSSISFGYPLSDAVAVDSSGKITNVYSKVSSVSIPSGGYVLCQATRREYEGNFFNSCKAGDTISRSISYSNTSSSNVQTAVAAGPSLVWSGGVNSSFTGEGITASDILAGTNRKVAIGTKNNGNTVVMMTAYCNLKQLANTAASIGCQNAMNLDGGSSAGIYYDGKWLIQPDRLLNNMIYFK